MNVNVRLEEILSSLRENEFVGKAVGAYVGKTLWYMGELDTRGVFQPILAAANLTELAGQMERRKMEETIRHRREAERAENI